MSDPQSIVERLRSVYTTHPMVLEAATEIERLQAELDLMGDALRAIALRAAEMLGSRKL